MEVLKFHRNELNMFDADHIKLVYEQDNLTPFINLQFSQDNFAIQLQQKKSNFDASSRTVLVDAIRSSYSNTDLSGPVSDNIEALLDENTFTITTGHQLSLFTGPLYFVLKILHVIKLSKTLNKAYPDTRFVPVFWMASEDHDFEEVQSLNLFTEKLVWNSAEKGPVGRISLDGMDKIRSEITALYENHPDSEIHELLKHYDGANYAEATLQLVHFIFKKYGLLVVDGDNSSLKKLFSATIEKELLDEFSFDEVSKTSELLRKQGIKTQVNPRELNLFYIKKGLRSRIEKKGDRFFIDGVGELSKEEILTELHRAPEAFSPNVVLRPLYQETILPNLAYVGGGAEMLYWLQLKGVFDAVNCTYPLIGVRNSVLLLDVAISKKISKLNLRPKDFFKNVEQIKKEYIEQNSGEELNLEQLDSVSKKLGEIMGASITKVNPSMESYAAAEITRLNKQIDGIKAKLVKMAKTNNEQAMKSIDHIKDRLFPEGKLQERSVNFFSFCPDGNFADRLDALYACLDPMVNDFIVVREFKSMK
jgi:bacillithiol biosynthesis cysteine-adding enzyme BshC